MAADRTLVDAAFREAKSRGGASGDIPGVIDRSSQYQSSIDISRQSLGLITGAMKGLNDKMEKQRLGAESQLKNFNNISKNNVKKLYDQKEPLPDKIIFAIEAQIKELQADFDKVNTYGKKDTSENEKARIKIEASLQRVINQAIDTRAGFMKISGNMKNLNVDQMSRNTDSIAPMETVLDLENMDANDNITVKVIDGNLTFITKDFYSDANSSWGKDGLSGDAGAVGMTMSQLQSYLPTKNAPHEIMLNDSYKTAITNGKNGGVDGVFNVEAAKGEILGHGSIADTQDFQSAMDQKHPQLGLSFTRSLTSNTAIPLSVIQAVFPNPPLVKDSYGKMSQGPGSYVYGVNVSPEYMAGIGIDANYGNEDGILQQSEMDAALADNDAADFYGMGLEGLKENAEVLIDAITNVDNPLFSESTSKDLYAGWVANTNKTVYDDGITKNVAAQQKVFDENNKASESQETYVDLPWQKGFDKPANITATAQLDLVQDILSERGEVPFGNDIYTLQKNGKYKLTGERKGEKTSPVESGKMLTKVQLIQRYGGIYGNIPDDYFDIKSIDHDKLSPTPNIETSKYLKDIGSTNSESNTSSKKTFNVGEIYPMGGKNYEYLKGGGFKEIVESKTLKFKDMPGDMKEILLPKHTGGDKAKADRKNKEYLAEYLKEDDTASWAEFDSWMEGK